MEPLVVLTRSERTECVHYGYICVTDSNNKIIFNIGDPDYSIYLRSTAKPFQAIAVVHSGALEKFKISTAELSIICASHSAQDYHLSTVRSILRKIGLSEEYLQCGAAMPYNKDASDALIKNGEQPSQIHNGCSGKHAGMLAVCRYYGFPPEGYCLPEHPVQKLIHSIIAEMINVDPEQLVTGLDGCGIPTFMVTMKQAAFLYSQLAAGMNGSTQYRNSLETIKNAMAEYPEMISGDEEFCTELCSFTHGKVIGKVGADGVYCVAIPDRKLGFSIKVIDGNERGLHPSAMHLLKQLNVIDDEAYEKLRRWARPEIRNHKGELAGYKIPVFKI